MCTVPSVDLSPPNTELPCSFRTSACLDANSAGGELALIFSFYRNLLTFVLLEHLKGLKFLPVPFYG